MQTRMDYFFSSYWSLLHSLGKKKKKESLFGVNFVSVVKLVFREHRKQSNQELDGGSSHVQLVPFDQFLLCQELKTWSDGMTFSLSTLRRHLRTFLLFSRKTRCKLLTITMFLQDQMETFGTLHGYETMHFITIDGWLRGDPRGAANSTAWIGWWAAHQSIFSNLQVVTLVTTTSRSINLHQTIVVSLRQRG